MNEQWQLLSQRYLNLSLREKLLVCLTGVVLVVFPAYNWWLEPTAMQLSSRQTALANAKTETSNALELIALSQAKLKEDPNKDLRAREAQLREQIGQIDQRLVEQQAGLIPVEQMSMVLQQLLQKRKGITLVSLRSLEPQAILSAEQADPDLNFYRHGIRLQLQSDYFALTDYLQEVEGLPQRFLWYLLDYKVEEYPKAEVTIDIYTLSTSKDFISG